ncbi:MAG TPA: S8 family serine peptidase, partial [Candidatus Thermoplasmatota archaeon]|nr:S8 family serine peptidase [Candidatus Thermoplasmatota archaeon]
MPASRASFLPLVLAVVLSVPALAADPFPGDPDLCATPAELGSGCVSPYDFAAYLFLPSLADLPSDYAGGDVWKYSSQQSGFPELDADPRELNGVTGMSVDRAWLGSTGRPDVVIAVLDSGIRWREGDLREKAYLNRGELPALAPSNPVDAWDTNFDGVVSAADYAGVVSDLNANGGLDAGDVVRHFSDGVDDDGNGFVDDVSGWDFVDEDNDAFDDVDYGHGTGEAKDSTAEAGNGGGMPGTCPSCRFMPLRVGLSFIAHSEDYAQAVLFAVDAGASVVQEALGTVDRVALVDAAHRYAWERGVPVVASAADEAAYHHNMPGGTDFTINVNSVRTGGELAPFPRSFLYVNGCTNFGGNVWVSVASTSCSSEATGRGAGIAGLLESHARNLVARGELAPHPDFAAFPSGNVLSAGEVRQLFRAGADDVDLSTKREVVSPVPTVRYASQPGWDQYTGWGRLNADKALALLDDATIPPAVAIVSPKWWESFDALQLGPGATIPVTVEFSTRPTTFIEGRVDYGCGVQPLTFRPLGQEIPDSPFVPWGFEGTGAEVAYKDTWTETNALLVEDIVTACGIRPGPPIGPNDGTITVRTRITVDGGVVGEDRRTIQLTIDPTLVPGWPRLVEGSGEASVDLVDLDGDGVDEILVPTASGILHALRADGSEGEGFPVTTDPMPGLHAGQRAFSDGGLDADAYFDSFSQGATAIADVDGKTRPHGRPSTSPPGHGGPARGRDLEIFATTLNGNVYGWDSDGSRLPGFPVSVDRAYTLATPRDRYNTILSGFEAAPTLADLDGDGDLEIVAAAMDRHVYAWHHDATPVAGFPVHLADATKVEVDPVTHRVTPRPGVGTYRGSQIVSTTAVGDLDGDGDLEIVVGSNEHYPEPVAVSAVSVTSTATALTGLLDTGNGRLYALHADGSAVAGFPVPVPDLAAELLPYVGEGVTGSPALADLDGDGADEIVVFATAGPVMVYRGDGSGFYGDGPDGLPLPLSMEAVGPLSGALDVPLIPAVGSPAVGSLAPGLPAIVAPAAGLGRALDVALPGEQVLSQDYVQAWDARTGLPLPAFPRPIEDLQFITTPAILNVDADPFAELVEGSGGYLLHAWNADGTEAVGFPKATQPWLIGTAAAGDVDGDGLREVVETSREGYVWMWRTTAVDALSFDEWWSDHHD